MKKKNKEELRALTGNAAAAYGAMLCRPDVVASYPITPQSEVIEQLSRFHAEGLLDAEMVEVEGENSAMNIVAAASIAGGRVFTATSSWGLAFMYDALLQSAGFRAPVVMVNVNREMPGILAVSAGQQDMIASRDSGWIQIVAEDCQEILDLVIMSYRLAEDFEIQLPVMVNYDGFYLSYLAERVLVPSRKDVDKFLAPLKEQPERPKLVPGKPVGCGSHGILEGFVELRYKHCEAMERAKKKLDEIDRTHGEFFERSYGGQIEEYRTEDAEIVLVTSGSASGTVKTVIDSKRKNGLKIGLVKIRMFRPFPCERLIQALQGKKAIGVIDRSVCFGWNCGPIYMELRALSPEIGMVPMMSFIDGLASMDITHSHVERMIKTVYEASQGKPYQKSTWVSLEE
ncbi:MAG: pyruvate synthase subunit PorA [Candidatus Aminicenantes bacterium]|nr:MAG: pyruvate synthase subunit PorA [Candidatus Aminicenantes bacterium]